MALREWDDLITAYKGLKPFPGGWMFRGQRNAAWPLESSLERAVSRRFGQPMATLGDYERRLSREFRRHYHKYSAHQPDPKDRVEWLAIMQHHGAPTRLLDWTYSFYIALFFAIETATPGDVCSIWILDPAKCWRMIEAKFPKLPEAVGSDETRAAALTEILDSSQLLVCPVNPFFMNERLAVQQGLFLAPCNACASFMENLRASAGEDPSAWTKLDIECSTKFLTEAFGHLHRMNVNRAALFPGLDGFAVGLQNLIPLQHLWVGV